MKSIDVIIPTHRNDSFLREALLSVKRSQNVSIRIILIDDRTLDDTLLPQELVDVIVKTPGGVGFENAINFASSVILSEFVAVMGSDDLVAPDKYIKQITQLEKLDANLSLCRLQKFGSQGTQPSMVGEILGKQYFSKILLVAPIGSNGSWVARRSWWKENVVFRVQDSDWALGLRIMMDTSIAYIPESLYFYRMHPSQMTRIGFEDKRLVETVYQDWSIRNEDLNLPSLSKSEFNCLLNPGLSKALKVDLRIISMWFTCFLKELTFRELVGLRRILGRKAIHLQLQTTRPLFGILVFFFEFMALPALLVDIFRVGLNRFKGDNSELRSRIWVDV